MEALAWIGGLGAALALAWSWPGWRLRRALARPLAPDMLAVLARNVAQYPRMAPWQQAQLQNLLKQFLHQKKFVGCQGFEVTDEVRVTIAAQACLLLLNRPGRVYPELHAVLVYPGAFLVPRRHVDEGGVVTEMRQDLLGESWGDGRVVLAWDHVARAGHDTPDGQNVVLHEFAHQLDSESGSTNGAPLLGSQANYRSWAAVLERDFASLRQEAMERQQGVLDHYGATSPAEFFAVSTETFFEKPWHMAARHPALFAQFEQYYGVDPRAWQDAPAVADSAPDDQAAAPGYGQWQ